MMTNAIETIADQRGDRVRNDAEPYDQRGDRVRNDALDLEVLAGLAPDVQLDAPVPITEPVLTAQQAAKIRKKGTK